MKDLTPVLDLTARGLPQYPRITLAGNAQKVVAESRRSVLQCAHFNPHRSNDMETKTYRGNGVRSFIRVFCLQGSGSSLLLCRVPRHTEMCFTVISR